MNKEEFEDSIKKYLEESGLDQVDENAKFLDLPQGRFYRPPDTLIRMGIAFGSFLVSLFIGNLFPYMLNITEGRGLWFTVPAVLIFMFGYFFWNARIQSILWTSFGKRIVINLIKHLFRWKKPEKITDILPPASEFLLAGLRAQKAASVFIYWGIFVWMMFNAVNFLFGFSESFFYTAFVSFFVWVPWSYFLYYLGRREYLPIGTDEE